MTINSLSSVASTVVGGLGTQTFNVVTAGFYNFSFKSFIPYLAAGSPPVTSNPTYEISDVTLVADVAGSLNSTYWTFSSAGDLAPYYVWYNINGAGVDPAVSGKTGIMVAGATGATAATLATATRAAITASSASAYVTVSGATTHVILTNKQVGNSTDAANGTASPGFSYSITQGSYGSPEISGLNVVLKQNSTVLASYGFPTPTQPIMGGSVILNAVAGDVLTIVFSSLSSVDNMANAVKSIVNLYQGV